MTIFKTEKDLVNTGGSDSPSYVLPFKDNLGNPIYGNKVPSVVLVNNVSIQYTFDGNAMLIYGFANNDPQTIIIKVI